MKVSPTCGSGDDRCREVGYGQRLLTVKRFAYAGFSLGLLLFVVLLSRQGVGEIAAAIAVAGWQVFVVALFHLLPILANTLGWQTLFPPSARPTFARLLYSRWIGEAVNALLPVAQIGGEAVKAQLVTGKQCSGDQAIASIFADLTVGLFAQTAFTFLGLILLANYFGDNGHAGVLFVSAAIALLLFGGFYVVQRLGALSKIAGKLENLFEGGDAWMRLSGGAKKTDMALNAIYRRHAEVFVSGMWRMLGWLAGVGEVWLAFYFMQQQVDFTQAFVLESLGQAVRAAAFFVPGALGVQEGGLVLLGAMVGISPEAALALSLIKRVRELTLGLPALIIWRWRARKKDYDTP